MANGWNLKAVLSASADGMTKTLKQVGLAAKNTRKYLSDVASAAGRLGSRIGLPLTLISGFLGGFSVAALKRSVTDYTAACDEIFKGAMRASMSFGEWQKMKFIADQTGTAIGTLEAATGKLNKSIGDAAAGKNKDLTALLKRLGISVRDANGNIRTSMDLLPQLADAFVRNENQVVRARMGTALFGKSWQEVMPLLMGGSAGLDDNIKRFDRLNSVISDTDVLAAKELGGKFTDLSTVTKNLQFTIARGLVPTLGPMVDDIVGWIVANKELISTKVGEFVKGVVQWLREVDWKGVTDGCKKFASGIRKLVDWIGGAKNALIGLALIMNAGTIAAVLGLAGSVFRLGMFLSGPLISAVTGVGGAVLKFGGAGLKLAGVLRGPVLSALRAVFMLMRANPIGLLITAVVGLGILIYKNFDKIVGYISSAWDRIKAVFEVDFFAGLVQLWLEAWQALANGVINVLKAAIPDFMMPDSFKNFEFSFASDRAEKLTGGANSPSIVNAGEVRASGQIEVSFKDAPPGTRIEQTKAGGDVPVNTNVGYRSYALGAP